MSIQAILNKQALSYVPNVLHIILNAPEFEANQMVNKTLHEMMQTQKRINEMTEIEIDNFEKFLIELFEWKGW